MALLEKDVDGGDEVVMYTRIQPPLPPNVAGQGGFVEPEIYVAISRTEGQSPRARVECCHQRAPTGFSRNMYYILHCTELCPTRPMAGLKYPAIT